MDTPIAGFPCFINELAEDYRWIFNQKRTFTQFKRMLTGFLFTNKSTITGINGSFIDHTDQSNLNRFVNSDSWSEYKLDKTRMGMINKVDGNGVVILDDYIVKKYGTKIYGSDYHFDHTEGKSVFGHNVVDCVYSGKGIFPLLQTLYIRKESKWLDGKKHQTKIELQKIHLTKLVDMGLRFSVVTFDSWYTTKGLIDHVESLNKDWVGQVKSNRQIKINDEWTSVKKYAESIFPDRSFKTVKIGDDTYLVKVITVEMKGVGSVRLLVSNNDRGNFKFFVSNRLDWNEAKMLKVYCRRWDIEVWHREGKVDYGLKDCRLRDADGVSKYLTLSSCADTFLEIVTLLSPLLGVLKRRVGTPGLKRRLLHLDLLRSFIRFVRRNGKKSYEMILSSVLYPYKSTKVKRVNLI